jgi:Ca-activated chloride channel family protein
MSKSNENRDPSALREDLQDRLADLALTEVLGGRRPPDLSQAVLAAPRHSHRSWRTIAKLALAASVLVALGTGIYAWRLSRSQLNQLSFVESKVSSADSLSSSNTRRLAPLVGAHFTGEITTIPADHSLPIPTNETKMNDIRDTIGRRTYDAWSTHRESDGVAQPDMLRKARVDLASPPLVLNPNGTGMGETGGREYRRMTSFAAQLDGLSNTAFQGEKAITDLTVTVRPRIIVQEEELENLRDADPAKPDQGRGPGEGGDRYSRIVENPFLKATDNPLSTFSIDVDTASYAKARRYLMQNGMLPPPDAVRIEEFVNYFHYDYAPPKDEKPFAAHVEVAACPWAEKRRLVRIGLKGREIAREARPPSNLVFLLDVSGSMEPDDKLPRVRRSMRMLVEQLGENDRVAIVVYAGATGLALPSTPGYRKEEIFTALQNLQAGGSTNGGAGIRLAYDLAATHFIKGGTNRVILCTDGDFNVGTTSTAELERLAEEKAKTGVFLTVLGFGMGNHNDDMLEKLADKGNGNYGYIDTEEEARKLLVEELSGTLVTIAKDVKIQVEFNPRTVGAYRLLGYENRMLRAEDFNDDKKDAGEIGAGHTVTALYEIVPAGEKLDTPPVDALRYQQLTRPADAAASGELLTLKLRYKEPDGQESKAPLVFPVSDRGLQFGQASKDFKFAAAVAGFAMLLRDSQYRGNLTYDAVLEIVQEGRGEDRNGYRAAFVEIARKAKGIAGK